MCIFQKLQPTNRPQVAEALQRHLQRGEKNIAAGSGFRDVP
jgi:hypothetical protein